MAQLVTVGRGLGTHYRANGNGPVPAGTTSEGDRRQPQGTRALLLPNEPRVESPVYDATPAEPTCH